MIVSLRVALVLGAVASALIAHNAAAADAPDDVVATVGADQIKASDIRTLLDALEPAQRQAIAKEPQALSRLVRSEAERIAVVKEAAANNWLQHPGIAYQLDRARQQTIYATYLQALAQAPADYPSDDEVKAAFEANKAQLVRPAQYHLVELYLELGAAADKPTQERLDRVALDLSKRARDKSAGFEKLAAPAQKGDPAITYRDLSWLGLDGLQPEVRPIVQGMAIGDVSQPIRMNGVMHIIKLQDLKPATPLGLAEVRDQLVDGLRRRKLQENEQAELAKIVGKTPPAINEIAVQKLLPTK